MKARFLGGPVAQEEATPAEFPIDRTAAVHAKPLEGSRREAQELRSSFLIEESGGYDGFPSLPSVE